VNSHIAFKFNARKFAIQEIDAKNSVCSISQKGLYFEEEIERSRFDRDLDLNPRHPFNAQCQRFSESGTLLVNRVTTSALRLFIDFTAPYKRQSPKRVRDSTRNSEKRTRHDGRFAP